jgi:hypothetical protein
MRDRGAFGWAVRTGRGGDGRAGARPFTPRPGAHRPGGGPIRAGTRTGRGLASPDGRTARADRWIQAQRSSAAVTSELCEAVGATTLKAFPRLAQWESREVPEHDAWLFFARLPAPGAAEVPNHHLTNIGSDHRHHVRRALQRRHALSRSISVRPELLDSIVQKLDRFLRVVEHVFADPSTRRPARYSICVFVDCSSSVSFSSPA